METKKSATVLMADDDEDDCFFVEDAFRASKMRATLRRVEDGVELVDYLRRRGKYGDADLAPWPDLILLDLNMPRMDGREALREIKSDPTLRRIPVVILTTSRETTDILWCYEQGASSFIVKPSDLNHFVGFAENLEKYWFEMVELPPEK